MATSLGSATLIQGADLNTDSSTQLMPLGAYAETSDGRGFRYCKVGGTSTVAGRIYQAPAEDTTNFQNLTVAVNSVGDLTVTTSTAVTLTANQLAGGTMVIVSATTGSGRIYRIKSHPAVTTAVVTITLEDPIAVATTGTVKIDMHPNPYNGVIITPAGAATSCPVGVSTYVITNAQFGWLQTHGPAPVLSSTAMTVGNNVIPLFATTAGAGTAAIDGVKSSIGYALTGIATTDVGHVYLTID
jgi:hypothetical protein